MCLIGRDKSVAAGEAWRITDDTDEIRRQAERRYQAGVGLRHLLIGTAEFGDLVRLLHVVADRLAPGETEPRPDLAEDAVEILLAVELGLDQRSGVQREVLVERVAQINVGIHRIDRKG